MPELYYIHGWMKESACNNNNNTVGENRDIVEVLLWLLVMHSEETDQR